LASSRTSVREDRANDKDDDDYGAGVGVRHRTGLPSPTEQPGEVNVTADVDFGALWEAVNLRMSLEESLERRLRWEGRARRRGKGSNATDEAVVNVSKPAHI
jgi:hypothetical protein